MLNNALILLTLALWPINLYLANTPQDFLTYVIPAILLLVSRYLYIKYPKYYLVPILAIGLFEKKLLILSIIFCLLELITKFSKKTLIFLGISIIILTFSFNSFKGQTIFNKDYEAEQLLIRNIHLYPDIYTARFFQNKPKIYLGKIYNNFFSLVDLNNYFFANHPAPITTSTQELYKYFYPLIIFLLLGIYNFKSMLERKFVLFSFIACLLSLVILNNFDRNDFILWVPISLIIIHGIKKTF
jgi:hypothetical protein